MRAGKPPWKEQAKKVEVKKVEAKKKEEAHHYWNVSLLTGDGSSGKTVGFKDGKLNTISDSSIKK